MEVLFLPLALEAALALYRQGVVLHADIEILLAHAWDFDLEHQLVLVLIDVDRGHKAGSGH
jgi:hypothetical protein